MWQPAASVPPECAAATVPATEIKTAKKTLMNAMVKLLLIRELHGHRLTTANLLEMVLPAEVRRVSSPQSLRAVAWPLQCPL
jgi:hypothetical protein